MCKGLVLCWLRTSILFENKTGCPGNNFTCTEGFWKCDNGKCIKERYVCDGFSNKYNDCGDGSDEVGCENYTCLQFYSKCADFKQCIKVNWLLFSADCIYCLDIKVCMVHSLCKWQKHLHKTHSDYNVFFWGTKAVFFTFLVWYPIW